MTEQRISVAMCTYNGEAYVAEQMDSILSQSRPAAEIVVCDDGSTDGTWTVLHEYLRRFPALIKLHRNDTNLGPAKNFEKAIGLCTGTLIALSDQDDVWHTNKLEILAHGFEIDPDLGLSFSNAERIDAEGSKLDADLWQTVGFHAREKVKVRHGHALEVFLRRPVATGCTIMFCATLKEMCLPIAATLMHDYWISLVAAVNSRIGFVDEKLVSYRQHTANAIGASRLSLAQRIEEGQRLGISECVQDAAGLRTLLARIENRDQHQNSLIRQKIDFLEFRIGLWSDEGSRLRKVGDLAREVLRGRYTRWANGWHTVAKDGARLLKRGK